MLLRYISLLLVSVSIQAAEIRGQVSLLAPDGYQVTTLARSEIYVALLSRAGQAADPARTHAISLSRSGMNRRYLLVRLGDSLLVNKRFSGSVRLKLFGRDYRKPLLLGHAPATVSIKPQKTGRYYLLNLVDNRQLLIVDVIRGHRVQPVKDGRFEISKVESGSWKIRLYSAITKPRSFEVDAYTAPVEKQFRLFYKPEVLIRQGLVSRQSGSMELYPE